MCIRDRYTEKLARALHVKGMINIQFIVDGDDVYIIEDVYKRQGSSG